MNDLALHCNCGSLDICFNSRYQDYRSGPHLKECPYFKPNYPFDETEKVIGDLLKYAQSQVDYYSKRLNQLLEFKEKIK